MSDFATMDSSVLAGRPTALAELAHLFTLTESVVEQIPAIRNLVTAGIATLATSQFVLEGEVIQSAVLAASLKRCSLLWKILFKELEAPSPSYPQRLLLKLQYCQRFCIQTFSTCLLDTKRSIVLDNAASLVFTLELSVAVIQGTISPHCLTTSLFPFHCGQLTQATSLIIAIETEYLLF